MKNIWSVEHILVKNIIFKLKRQVEKGERNDKMTRKTKSKAFTLDFKSKLKDNINADDVVETPGNVEPKEEVKLRIVDATDGL